MGTVAEIEIHLVKRLSYVRVLIRISCVMLEKYVGNYLVRLTNRFQVAVRLFSNRSQMTSKCGKNKKSGTDARKLGIYLFYIIKN